MADSGDTEELKADGGLEFAEADAFQPALLMPVKDERESVLPGVAYETVYVMKFVLVDVDVIVVSGPTNVYSVEVYVGAVMYCGDNVVDSSATRLEEVGVTKTDIVFVTSETPPLGDTPLSR